MTILVKQINDLVVSASPIGYEDGDGQLWIAGIDDILVEGWEEQAGAAGAMPVVYRLETPAMFLYDDPFCGYCRAAAGRCEC